MKLIERLKSWWNTEKPITPDQVIDDDPYIREVVAAAWNSGNAIVGYVDEDGKLHLVKHEKEK